MVTPPQFLRVGGYERTGKRRMDFYNSRIKKQRAGRSHGEEKQNLGQVDENENENENENWDRIELDSIGK